MKVKKVTHQRAVATSHLANDYVATVAFAVS